jgi:hypothetical protein
MLRSNDSDLYPSAEKDPYTDTTIAILIGLCNTTVVVIFAYLLWWFISQSTKRVANAAVRGAPDSETWHFIVAESSTRLQELMQPNHPSIELLQLVSEYIERNEWCGGYAGGHGKEELLDDLQVCAQNRMLQAVMRAAETC